jgi:hypothetical protein
MTPADVGSPTKDFAHHGTICLATNGERPTAEKVAGVVAGIPAIGKAREALTQQGWRARIAGNRIAVNDEVFALFIGATVNPSGAGDTSWVISRIVGTPPVWIVGAEPQRRHTPDTATATWWAQRRTSATDYQGPRRSPISSYAPTPTDGVGDDCSEATKISTLQNHGGN